MTYVLSEPIENVLEDLASGSDNTKPDVVVVGSGYGGSVAALRLAGEGRKVWVLERGREYAPGQFPDDVGGLPGHIRVTRSERFAPIGYEDALFDLRIGKDIDVLVGCGLGGTSLINASVAARPGLEVFDHLAWPRQIRDDRNKLAEAMNKVCSLLGVREAPTHMRGKRFEALERLAPKATPCFGPAPLAVHFSDRPGTANTDNGVGLRTPGCTGCGNCVTGCNVGAKGSLDRNLLPLARARGARLFTGAVVLSIERSDSISHPWRVRFRPSAHPVDQVFELSARLVVLAAGTLGSTEILMRSQARGRLRLSSHLGRRFSGNGDAIAASFGQSEPVEPCGAADPRRVDTPGGPSITGMIRIKARDPKSGLDVPLTVEDGGVPYALRHVFSELVCFGAQTQRLGNNRYPPWIEHKRRIDPSFDPLAMGAEVARRSQSLLIMGDDGAGGRLELRYPKSAAAEPNHDLARIAVEWPGAALNPASGAAHAWLDRQSYTEALDGGQYVPNPAARPVMGEIGMLAGATPAARSITVHPLGGCSMGESVDLGVVNADGQLFERESALGATGAYDGLYVLDGSILPCAVAINPFLTIAALAWRACDSILAQRNWPESQRQYATVEPAAARAGEAIPWSPVALEFTEQLTGRIKLADCQSLPHWFEQMVRLACGVGIPATRAAENRGLGLKVTMSVPDVDAWMASPGTAVLMGKADLMLNWLSAEEERTKGPGQVISDHFKSLGTGKCAVRLLTLDAPANPATALSRTLRAIGGYLRRRQSFWQILRSWRERPTGAGSLASLRAFLAVARQHADYRLMTYEMTLRTEAGLVELTGSKRIAWRTGSRRLVDALIKLPFEIRSQLGGPALRGVMRVDLLSMSKEGSIRVSNQASLPNALLAVGRVGLFYGRALLHSMLWDFGAPDYPRHALMRRREPYCLRSASGERVHPQQIVLRVPLVGAVADSATVPLVMTRYAARRKDAPPVLLVHGLAQGSLIFTTPSIKQNMAEALWDAGYDIWLVDYRLSPALPEPVPMSGWSMEEIGRFDIAAAICHVYDQTFPDARAGVRVFAHCVGATAVTMALLGEGWLPAGRIGALAINAIQPWLRFSVANRLRANLATVLRGLIGDDQLDPIPRPNPGNVEQIFDRLAYVLGRTDEDPSDRRQHRPDEDSVARAICDRMTMLYGRMWQHEHLHPRTHAAFGDLMGPSPSETYRQLFYFAVRERVTNRAGENEFLRSDRVRAAWNMPTCFFHGAKSLVFNPHSARISGRELGRILTVGTAGRAPNVSNWEIEDFGHMDVVFARDAHREVYPKLIQFFGETPPRPPSDAPSVPDSGRQWYPSRLSEDDRNRANPHQGPQTKPSLGPILRSAHWHNGAIRLRYWMELPCYANEPAVGVQIRAHDTVLAECGSMLDDNILWVEVELPAASSWPDCFTVQYLENGGSARTAREVLPVPPWVGRLRGGEGRPGSTGHFVVASCRYPGSTLDVHRSDWPFAGIARHVDGVSGPGIGQVFLLGDQIYADATAQIIDADDWRERYVESYRRAFGSESFSHLVRRVPVYFAVDDHELADNWSGEDLVHLDKGRSSAFAYQGPAPLARPPNSDWPMWRRLAAEEFPFPAFMADTRFQRKCRGANILGASGLLGDRQRQALDEWLYDHRNDPRPKFLFSGVVVAPVRRDIVAHPSLWRREDGWAGYPESLAWLAERIVTLGVENVVLVAGDLHFSAVARLTLSWRDRKVTAWQLVSSPLYAPMPFANADPADYDWNVSVNLPISPNHPIVAIEYRACLLSCAPSQFMRVDVEPEPSPPWWRIHLKICGPEGLTEPPPRGDLPDWLFRCANGLMLKLQ